MILSRGKVIRFQSFNACRELPVRIYLSTTQDFHYSLDCHPEVEFQFVRRGKGAYFIAGVHCPYQQNSFLIIKPNEPHRGLPSSGCRVEKVCLVFTWQLVEDARCLSFLEKLPRLIQLQEPTATRILLMLHNIAREVDEKDEDWRDMVANNICNLLTLLHRSPGVEISRPASHPVVEKAESFINKHFKESISIQRLANKFHISPSRLSHLFKQDKGWGIAQYVLDRKLAAAKMLLERKPGRKLSIVAEAVGFRDYRLFHRHFTNLIGCTPSEYRIFQTRTPKSSVGVGK